LGARIKKRSIGSRPLKEHVQLILPSIKVHRGQMIQTETMTPGNPKTGKHGSKKGDRGGKCRKSNSSPIHGGEPSGILTPAKKRQGGSGLRQRKKELRTVQYAQLFHKHPSPTAQLVQRTQPGTGNSGTDFQKPNLSIKGAWRKNTGHSFESGEPRRV